MRLNAKTPKNKSIIINSETFNSKNVPPTITKAQYKIHVTIPKAGASFYYRDWENLGIAFETGKLESVSELS